jgi:hypothetical protein
LGKDGEKPGFMTPGSGAASHRRSFLQTIFLSRIEISQLIDIMMLNNLSATLGRNPRHQEPAEIE